MIQGNNSTHSIHNSVAGRGLNSLPLPAWVKVARNLLPALAGTNLTLAIAQANQWSWITESQILFTALWALAAIIAFAAGFAALRWTPVLWPLLGIRTLKNENHHKKIGLVYGGHSSGVFFVALIALTGGLSILTSLQYQSLFAHCPLPSQAVSESVAVPEPTNDFMPIHFWDYALLINPDKLGDFDVILPYEKGPPQKLMGRVLIQHRSTQTTALELHGKRPRTYDENTVQNLFAPEDKTPLSTFNFFGSGRSLATLSREAGIDWTMLSPQTTKTLAITRLELHTGEVTMALGLPWQEPVKQFFYWGPGGTVFQVRCGKSLNEPCLFNEELKNARFALDPKGSLQERKSWTTTRIQTLLSELAQKGATLPSQDKQKQETLLSFYLISLLTLDPRDPEAYFHLGKMAHNRETILSAIRYGHDVGLAPAKLAELQAQADR